MTPIDLGSLGQRSRSGGICVVRHFLLIKELLPMPICERKERMVKIFIDRESLAPQRCEFEAYQDSEWLSGIHTVLPGGWILE